jgi:hypothetical protein
LGRSIPKYRYKRAVVAGATSPNAKTKADERAMSMLRYYTKMVLPALFLACMAAGCGSQHIAQPVLSTVATNAISAGLMSLAPATLTIPMGSTGHLSLASGVSGCVWTSATPIVALSQGNGDFLGVNDGTTTVSVTCGTQTSSATVAVTRIANPNAISITSGGTYSGNWSSTDPTQPAILVFTNEPVTVVDSTVTGPGTLIVTYGSGAGANLTLRNVTGIGLDPGVKGLARGKFLAAEVLQNLSVTHCTMIGTSFGIYVMSSVFDSLTISDNVGENLDDRIDDGNGGFLLNQRVVGHFIILGLSKVKSGEISWNQVVNTPGVASIEDVISFYQTLGVSPSQPILLHDNYIQGAFATGFTTGFTGGGIQFDGGSNDPASANGFVNVYNNVIVHSAGFGISIGAGHDITVTGNRVVSCGQDGFGNWFNINTYAYGMWNFYGTTLYANNRIFGNTGGAIGLNGPDNPVVADYNTPSISAASNDTVANNAMDDPCWNNGQVIQTPEAAEWDAWQARLTGASRQLGDLH